MAESKVPDTVLYTREHVWITKTAPWKIGVSDFAQKALGDLTYVELPKVGEQFEAGQEFGSLESTKSVSPLYMPVSGTIKAVNERLNDAPELVNKEPYEGGWIVEIETTDPLAGLYDDAIYQAYLETL